MTDINGYCDPKFQDSSDTFARCFANHGDVGASVCVTVEGEKVVDLWGGFADENLTGSWDEDTLCVIFSATKAIVNEYIA